MRHKQSGFTLVEIAIVLVIIGLLLGGILKGQELVQNARVRNVADQQNAIKAAYYAFQDRYRALPGDYAAASGNIPNVTSSPTCSFAGTGTPNADTECRQGDARVSGPERVFAWHHLTNAGFISCAECANAPGASATPGQGNSPTNAYGGIMEIRFDRGYAGTASDANNLRSGTAIPSNVLAEVDRKIDDGSPISGSFRSTETTSPTCYTAANSTPAAWIATTSVANCGAANLL
jgi:prepilin-type N-terminal cleavage/methylation domain-containing protein